MKEGRMRYREGGRRRRARELIFQIPARTVSAVRNGSTEQDPASLFPEVGSRKSGSVGDPCSVFSL